MSRVGKMPVIIPENVEISLIGDRISIKSVSGSFLFLINPLVKASEKNRSVIFSASNDTSESDSMSGTARSVFANMVTGVSVGFQRKLVLVGVGYRAAVVEKNLSLQIGFSHPVSKAIPSGISIQCPTQSEIIVKGFCKELVGQISAEIRAIRPPEPYKGKGIRYFGEKVLIKETSKKK
jgi:large subunit ribosomal protein L6